MSPERVSVGEEGEGHSMLMDRKKKKKKKKAREPTVESLVRGIWRLRVSKEERRVREGVKVEDNHRDKTEQCP